MRLRMPAADPKSFKETALEAENADLRDLLTQAGIDAARLPAQAGIDATENQVAKRLQHLLLEELHHRVKNTLATVIAITSQSLRNAASRDEAEWPSKAAWARSAGPTICCLKRTFRSARSGRPGPFEMNPIVRVLDNEASSRSNFCVV
jgi:hypothetical protein